MIAGRVTILMPPKHDWHVLHLLQRDLDASKHPKPQLLPTSRLPSELGIPKGTWIYSTHLPDCVSLSSIHKWRDQRGIPDTIEILKYGEHYWVDHSWMSAADFGQWFHFNHMDSSLHVTCNSSSHVQCVSAHKSNSATLFRVRVRVRVRG